MSRRGGPRLPGVAPETFHVELTAAELQLVARALDFLQADTVLTVEPGEDRRAAALARYLRARFEFETGGQR
jgi:hypothetical protein